MSNEIHFRPWGSYEILAAGDGYQVKRLTISPGAVTSLQTHQHRSETWKVVQGEARVRTGPRWFTIDASSPVVTVPETVRHRVGNEGDQDLVMIEIQQGSVILEEDIVRHSDIYGRV